MTDVIPIASPDLGEDEVEEVAEVVRSGYLSQGERVEAFEQEFADHTGAGDAVATTNGSVALEIALRSLGVGPGDEVIVPDLTFVATANMVLAAGATPVLCDVEPDTFTLDPGAARDAISERTRALLPVHLYGQPADVPALIDLAEEHDLALLGDAAQAHGAALDGTRAGALCDAATFSFYPTKNMTTGEGGMITFRDAGTDAADLARSLRNHGRPASETDTADAGYEHLRWGHNGRMNEIAAAIGLVQLAKLDDLNARRQENARRLDDALGDVDGVSTPPVRDGATHVYHQYTIRCDDRDALAEHLASAEIHARVYYRDPLHTLPHLADAGRTAGDLKRTSRTAEDILSLPIHPDVSPDDIDRIAETVRDWAEGR